MKWIDLDSWNRKHHFHLFQGMDYPHFNICANLDMTYFKHYTQDKGLPFFLSFLYTACKTANAIPEFRMRIRDNRVVEHDRVDPSFTYMTDQGVFSFCTAAYNESFHTFLDNTASLIEKAKREVDLQDEPERDDLLYVTSIPWVSFTSLTHPIHMHPVDSIPRLSWGKFFEETGKILIPFSIQAHHALVDGAHIGDYFRIMEELLNHPDQL